MKKIICLVLILFIILGTAACGTIESNEHNDEPLNEQTIEEIKIESKTDKIKAKILSATDIKIFKELLSDVYELNEEEKNFVAQRGAVYLCNIAFSRPVSSYTRTEEFLEVYDDLGYVIKTFEVLGLNKGEYEEHYNYIVNEKERALTLSQYDEYMLLMSYMSDVMKFETKIMEAIKEKDSYNAVKGAEELKKYSYEIKYEGNCINSTCFKDAILETCESACDMAKYYEVFLSTGDNSYFTNALNASSKAHETMGKYLNSYNEAYSKGIMSIPMLSYNAETIWYD